LCHKILFNPTNFCVSTRKFSFALPKLNICMQNFFVIFREQMGKIFESNTSLWRTSLIVAGPFMKGVHTCKMIVHYCHSLRELTTTSWQRRGTFDKSSTYRQTRKWLVGLGEGVMKTTIPKQSQGDDENQRRLWNVAHVDFSLSGECIITSIVWNYVRPWMPRIYSWELWSSVHCFLHLFVTFICSFGTIINLEWMNEWMNSKGVFLLLRL
jgi:hypothetical protein